MNYGDCHKCGEVLVEPFIKCAECKTTPVLLCVQCFARGQELRDHKNYHAYHVVRSDFKIFGSWMAFEELKLLDAIEHSGFGNWAGVSSMMGTRTAAECERHYMKYYINNPYFPIPVRAQRYVLEDLSFCN